MVHKLPIFHQPLCSPSPTQSMHCSQCNVHSVVITVPYMDQLSENILVLPPFTWVNLYMCRRNVTRLTPHIEIAYIGLRYWHVIWGLFFFDSGARNDMDADPEKLLADRMTDVISNARKNKLQEYQGNFPLSSILQYLISWLWTLWWNLEILIRD